MRCATAAPRAGRSACCSAAGGEGEFLRIEVKDNGPGIAADKQAIIFDEFVRLQPEDDRPREERGLGLGLAIVDRIARMLELPVRISSAPGQGSTFSVLVPRVAGGRRPARRPRRLPPPRLPVEAESFVLCIDNEARVREAMAALLGGWGCRVATAATHAEALRRVAEAGRLPDLVLADLHLDEGPDGLEVVEPAAQDLEPRRAGRADHRRPRPHAARCAPAPVRSSCCTSRSSPPRCAPCCGMRERTLG